MKKNDIQKNIYTILIIIMLFIPLVKFISYALYLSGIIKDSFSFNQVYVLWIFIPILIANYVYGIIAKKIRINYIDIIIYLLSILAIISTIFALDITKSIVGEVKRNEGLLTIICYYLLFLNSKYLNNEKWQKKLIGLFMIIGLFQVGYSVLQVYTNFSFIRHFRIPYMGMGLCANPNFFGSYMVMLSLLSTCLYIFNKQKKFLFLSVIYFIGLCIANSTAPLLAFIITFVFINILHFKKRILKSSLIIFVLLTITFFTLDASNRYTQTEVLNNTVQPKYIVSEEISEVITKQSKIGSDRFAIWSNSLPILKKYWITGAGLDNFYNAYILFSNSKVDKAHNVYLQIAVTNGIPALILYLIINAILFIKGFKFKQTLEISLYACFVGYCVQAFVNISVIDVAPYFYIILGLLYSFKNNSFTLNKNANQVDNLKSSNFS